MSHTTLYNLRDMLFEVDTYMNLFENLADRNVLNFDLVFEVPYNPKPHLIHLLHSIMDLNTHLQVGYLPILFDTLMTNNSNP